MKQSTKWMLFMWVFVVIGIFTLFKLTSIMDVLYSALISGCTLGVCLCVHEMEEWAEYEGKD